MKVRNKFFVTPSKFSTSVDFISAPFICAKRHLFKDGDNPALLFRSALRIYLVYNILINLNINDRLREAQMEHGTNSSSAPVELRRLGLLYLRMKRAYTDAFVVHDESVGEPYIKQLRTDHPELYDKIVSKAR